MCYNDDNDTLETLICQAEFLYDQWGVSDIKSKDWAHKYEQEVVEEQEKNRSNLAQKRNLENCLAAIQFIVK